MHKSKFWKIMLLVGVLCMATPTWAGVKSVQQTAEISEESDLEKDYELSYDHAYDGSESGKALICWLRLTTNANGDRVTPTVDDALLEEARQQAEKFQNENQPDQRNRLRNQPLSQLQNRLRNRLRSLLRSRVQSRLRSRVRNRLHNQVRKRLHLPRRKPPRAKAVSIPAHRLRKTLTRSLPLP